MQEDYLKSLAPAQRKEILQTSASEIENGSYQKPLTQDELDLRRTKVADNTINVFDMEDELKKVKAEYKQKIDPLKDENKVMLREIKTRQQTVKGTLYHLANYDASMMETYDENGNMISSRRLRPDEKQQNIYPLKKAQ